MKLYFNYKQSLVFSALSLFFSLALAIPVLADDVPTDEMTISKNGDMTVIGHVQLKQAANAFRVSVWGQVWDILADYDVRFESKYGATIQPADVQQDDVVQILGKPTPASGAQRAGQINATLVRDLSNTTGQPPPSPIVSITSPTPKKISASVSPKKDSASAGLLTEHLELGTRGDEVSLLQKFLETHGSGIPDGGITTGYFGKVTEKILKSFQDANGLASVGAVGAQTRQLINSMIQKDKSPVPSVPPSDGRLSLPIVKATTTSEATTAPAIVAPKKKRAFFFGS